MTYVVSVVAKTSSQLTSANSIDDERHILQTLCSLLHDVIAPDVRELKVRVEGLEKQIEANTKAILAAIGESKAQSELASMTAVASLRERVAVLESKHN